MLTSRVLRGAYRQSGFPTFVVLRGLVRKAESQLQAKRPTPLEAFPARRSHFSSMSAANGASKEKKSYHKKATGSALKTAEAHADEHELKLFGSCFW